MEYCSFDSKKFEEKYKQEKHLLQNGQLAVSGLSGKAFDVCPIVKGKINSNTDVKSAYGNCSFTFEKVNKFTVLCAIGDYTAVVNILNQGKLRFDDLFADCTFSVRYVPDSDPIKIDNVTCFTLAGMFHHFDILQELISYLDNLWKKNGFPAEFDHKYNVVHPALACDSMEHCLTLIKSEMLFKCDFCTTPLKEILEKDKYSGDFFDTLRRYYKQYSEEQQRFVARGPRPGFKLQKRINDLNLYEKNLKNYKESFRKSFNCYRVEKKIADYVEELESIYAEAKKKLYVFEQQLRMEPSLEELFKKIYVLPFIEYDTCDRVASTFIVLQTSGIEEVYKNHITLEMEMEPNGITDKASKSLLYNLKFSSLLEKKTKTIPIIRSYLTCAYYVATETLVPDFVKYYRSIIGRTDPKDLLKVENDLDGNCKIRVGDEKFDGVPLGNFIEYLKQQGKDYDELYNREQKYLYEFYQRLIPLPSPLPSPPVYWKKMFSNFILKLYRDDIKNPCCERLEQCLKAASNEEQFKSAELFRTLADMFGYTGRRDSNNNEALDVLIKYIGKINGGYDKALIEFQQKWKKWDMDARRKASIVNSNNDTTYNVERDEVTRTKLIMNDIAENIYKRSATNDDVAKLNKIAFVYELMKKNTVNANYILFGIKNEQYIASRNFEIIEIPNELIDLYSDIVAPQLKIRIEKENKTCPVLIILRMIEMCYACEDREHYKFFARIILVVIHESLKVLTLRDYNAVFCKITNNIMEKVLASKTVQTINSLRYIFEYYSVIRAYIGRLYSEEPTKPLM